MANSAPVMIWVADTTRACDWFNLGWLRFTGRTMAQERGFGWAQGVHPDDYQRCLAIYMAAFDARQAFSMEYRLRRHDGAFRYILDNGAPRFEEDGVFCGYVGSCIDVQEARNRDEIFAALARDRLVLLREVHHRVKNNFQLVMSIIGLRSDALEAESVEGVVLRELQTRVGVMASIQEELVSQPQVDRIDFAGQLRRLMVNVDAMHDGPRVAVSAEIEPLDMPVDRAFTLGLIAAELLSNIYRHAFCHRGGQGHLWVRLENAGEMVVLTMRDDGPGIPPPEARPRSVGLQIVHALAMQADGEVEVDTAPGSTVRVRMRSITS